MESLVELFCSVDDFCQAFLPTLEQHLISSGLKSRGRARSLAMRPLHKSGSLLDWQEMSQD
ncbi:MAG: hypothetical protein ACUVWR_18405, partial [Anaerolineae bacterium]